jgi:hypothetical protein
MAALRRSGCWPIVDCRLRFFGQPNVFCLKAGGGLVCRSSLSLLVLVVQLVSGLFRNKKDVRSVKSFGTSLRKHYTAIL